jgi:uncharacterized protein (TIGR00299 family) protein
MKAALFDPFSGVSGNMILGSLLDAGLAETDLRNIFEQLIPAGWSMSVERVPRGGIMGTHVEISVTEDQPLRLLRDVERIIDGSGLPSPVKEAGWKTFRRLAEAEAAVHGMSPHEVHFHEVGAVDAILDVMGSFAGLNLLGVERVYSMPVATGRGTVDCMHGTLPVPAPVTLQLLVGVPVIPSAGEGELATPTGVAILTTAVEDWKSPLPLMRICSTGMGAGTRENEKPNLLRVSIGDVLEKGISPDSDTCVVLTAVVDDLDPRIWPVLSAALLEAGALDCYTTHCTGKKGRPALEMTVICPPDMADALSTEVLTRSTTLGVRVDTVPRRILSRSFRKVSTPWGDVRVKTGRLDDQIVSAEPEFEDCARIARDAGVPVKIVLQEARGKAMAFLRGEFQR